MTPETVEAIRAICVAAILISLFWAIAWSAKE